MLWAFSHIYLSNEPIKKLVNRVYCLGRRLAGRGLRRRRRAQPHYRLDGRKSTIQLVYELLWAALIEEVEKLIVGIVKREQTI